MHTNQRDERGIYERTATPSLACNGAAKRRFNKYRVGNPHARATVHTECGTFGSKGTPPTPLALQCLTSSGHEPVEHPQTPQRKWRRDDTQTQKKLWGGDSEQISFIERGFLQAEMARPTTRCSLVACLLCCRRYRLLGQLSPTVRGKPSEFRIKKPCSASIHIMVMIATTRYLNTPSTASLAAAASSSK